MPFDLSTEIAGIKLKNPTILASGILGVTRSSLGNVIKHGAGAVTIKSISKDPRKGHNNPTIITYEAGMINAVGYPNEGIEWAKKEFVKLNELEAPVIGSIIGRNADEFAYMARNFIDNDENDFDAVEIPLSCPHTPGYGTLAGQNTPESTYKITKAVKENCSLPVFVKLSPDVPSVVELAKAAQSAGADAITAVNTMGPGMVIDIKSRQPVLDFKMGGISGHALRPIAIRCVYEIYPHVRIPIIGTGGVINGHDAIEMLMAGATGIGIGTALYYRDIDTFRLICQEIADIAAGLGYKSIKEIIGKSHQSC